MANVRFLEDSHRYLSDKGELISVSKFFDSFKEKIDWDTIALNCAKKATRNGVPTTKRDILEKWANKRDKASEVGTIYHSIRENQLLASKDPEFYGIKCEKKGCTYIDGLKHSIPISDVKNNTVYPELMIYDEEHMICGQSDKVIVLKNTINIWDYKTDKEITFKAFSSKWVDPRKLLSPLSHLDDANGNHYAIKMSLYMYLLWKANKGKFKPGEIIIEHIHLKRDPDNDDIPILDSKGSPVVTKIEQIKLPYYKKEVIEMLKTIKK